MTDHTRDSGPGSVGKYSDSATTQSYSASGWGLTAAGRARPGAGSRPGTIERVTPRIGSSAGEEP